MKNQELLKKLKGIHTIESIKDILSVNKKKAIYYIHRLRRQGYVKTRKLPNNKRVYSISFENRLGGFNYSEIINKYSPIKIASSEHKIYGKKPTPEETLTYAIKTRNLRTILASLALFKKIKNWPLLYKLAKQNNLEREVGALYDLSRKIMRTRKMTKRFRKNSLPKDSHYRYILKGMKSKDFNEIEKIWKIYLPFNKQDLEDYKSKI